MEPNLMNPTELEQENATLERHNIALRGEIQAMRKENAELRNGIRQRDHWINDLRETVEALLKPSKAA
jgi:predicted nuclease with TOPRIM domain